MRASERTELAAVADVDEKRANEAAAAYGIRPYTDYRQMLVKERPDIVVITLPHALHKEAALACITAGCHVLLEKPMAINEQECAEINDAAARAGIVLAVGHMQHYFSENRKAREMVASGRLGKLVMINERRYGYYFSEKRPNWFLDKKWSGGGMAINIGSHSIDKIQWMTDSRIATVCAHLTYHGERGDVEGSASLLMRTSSGVSVNASLYGYRAVPINETEFLFTGGSMRLVARRGLWISGENGYEPVKTEPMTEPFTPQWDDALDAIEHGSELSIAGTYAQTVAATVDALYRSHETGMEQKVGMSAALYNR